MKNFSRRSSHGHHSSNKALWTGATRTLTWIARIHSQSHTHINTVTMMCEVPAQLIHNLESTFYFWREGEKTRVPGENPWQPACKSVSHIRGEYPTSWMGLEPSPSNIGDKLAWPRARAMSHPLSLQTTASQIRLHCTDHTPLYWSYTYITLLIIHHRS